jgi:hypothetical protein
MDIDEIVKRAVYRMRAVFIGLFAVGSAAIIYFEASEWFVVLGLVMFILYSVCMNYIAVHIVRSMNPDDLISALQAKKINDINSRLSSGDLKPGKELDDLMRASGLRPMAVIVQKGPIIGRFADSDMHEWIEATEGHDGELSRYELIGKAEFAENGAVVTPSMYHLYVVLEGILYESKVPESDTERT